MLRGKRLPCFHAHFLKVKTQFCAMVNYLLFNLTWGHCFVLCVFLCLSSVTWDLLPSSWAAKVIREHSLASVVVCRLWMPLCAAVAMNQLIGRGIAFGVVFIP